MFDQLKAIIPAFDRDDKEIPFIVGKQTESELALGGRRDIIDPFSSGGELEKVLKLSITECVKKVQHIYHRTFLRSDVQEELTRQLTSYCKKRINDMIIECFSQ